MATIGVTLTPNVSGSHLALRQRPCSAISNPSIANTSPIAAPKSRISVRFRRRRRGLGRGRLRRRGFRRRRGGREIAEEVRLRTDERARPPVGEAILVGLHRTIE